MNRTADIVVVITARLTSERLPGKVLSVLGNRTALAIQVMRARQSGFPVVVAVPSDEPELIEYANSLPVDSVYGGEPRDVVSLIYHAAKQYKPKVVIRGLPDCPYFDYSATRIRAEKLLYFGIAHATRSRQAFGRDPVYGADEPAYSWGLVMHMLGEADGFEREHFGSLVDRRRGEVNILYTSSPPVHLYRDMRRPYRLELDTPEDREMLDLLMQQTGPLGSISTAVSILERSPDLVKINSHVEEKTGPTTSYKDYVEAHERASQRSYAVDEGNLLLGLAERFVPVLCDNGRCLVGYREDDGYLHRLTGEKIRGGEIPCPCGVGRTWHFRPPAKSSTGTAN